MMRTTPTTTSQRGRMRMKRETIRPRYRPTRVIKAVMAPNSMAGTNGDRPSKPRPVPAITLSRLSGTGRPKIDQRCSDSSSSWVAVRNARAVAKPFFHGQTALIVFNGLRIISPRVLNDAQVLQDGRLGGHVPQALHGRQCALEIFSGAREIGLIIDNRHVVIDS